MKGKKAKNPAEILSKKGVKPSKEVMKRFFADKCTILEVQKVHEWFATAGGQKCVSKELEKDFKLFDDGFEVEHTCDAKIVSVTIFNKLLKNISLKSSNG